MPNCVVKWCISNSREDKKNFCGITFHIDASSDSSLPPDRDGGLAWDWSEKLKVDEFFERMEMAGFDEEDVEELIRKGGMRQLLNKLPTTVGLFGSGMFAHEWDFTPTFTRDIPHDFKLRKQMRYRIHKVEHEMDDLADGLPGTERTFNWHSNFDGFRSVRQPFTGPIPGPIKDYDSPYDAFIDIWNQDIMRQISVETNRYANLSINSRDEADDLDVNSRYTTWEDTSVDELYKLFGMYILMGLARRHVISDYWTDNKYLEMPAFKHIMSYEKYVLLNKFLHFVDNATLADALERRQQNGETYDPRLIKLQPIIDWLNTRFGALYNLRSSVTIDESLLLHRHSYNWTEAMHKWVHRFALKSIELCEAETGYLHKVVIYTGERNNSGENLGVEKELGFAATQAVLEVTRDLLNRGHCLTMNNFYICPALARFLKLNKTDCLGTVRANRRHLPSDISQMRPDVERGTMVARHSGDMTIIAWKESELINLLSTYHNADTFESRRPCASVKPLALRDYNKAMGGINTKNKTLNEYHVEAKSNIKWFIKMFKRLYEASIYNAWILYNESRKRRDLPGMTHRIFRYELSEDLISRHEEPSPIPTSVPFETQLRTDRRIIHKPSAKRKRGRCVICYRLGKTKTLTTRCETCKAFLCFGTCWLPYHSLDELPERPTK